MKNWNRSWTSQSRIEWNARNRPPTLTRSRQAISHSQTISPTTASPECYLSEWMIEVPPTGLPITDQLLQRLASVRSDGNILPLPFLTVQRRLLKGEDVAVVLVEPADAPPVRYKGTVWVRIGPRRAGVAPEKSEHWPNAAVIGTLPLTSTRCAKPD